ncbi:Uncharacterised protein [Candidatus Tiddalikarchaeum anstoanum]|nr:Uncharacterised protein [Candidatus Tiddalikarchaeum anstoanum]
MTGKITKFDFNPEHHIVMSKVEKHFGALPEKYISPEKIHEVTGAPNYSYDALIPESFKSYVLGLGLPLGYHGLSPKGSNYYHGVYAYDDDRTLEDMISLVSNNGLGAGHITAVSIKESWHSDSVHYNWHKYSENDYSFNIVAVKNMSIDDLVAMRSNVGLWWHAVVREVKPEDLHIYYCIVPKSTALTGNERIKVEHQALELITDDFENKTL